MIKSKGKRKEQFVEHIVRFYTKNTIKIDERYEIINHNLDRVRKSLAFHNLSLDHFEHQLFEMTRRRYERTKDLPALISRLEKMVDPDYLELQEKRAKSKKLYANAEAPLALGTMDSSSPLAAKKNDSTVEEMEDEMPKIHQAKMISDINMDSLYTNETQNCLNHMTYLRKIASKPSGTKLKGFKSVYLDEYYKEKAVLENNKPE